MPATTEPVVGTSYTHRAWWSLLGFVPSLALAFLVGEGLITALGYDTAGGTTPPVWAILVAVVPALVVFVLPAVVAVHFARRAIRLGDDRGHIPLIVAIVIAAGFVLLNGVSGIAVLLS